MFEHVVTSAPDRVELHPATFPAEWILDGNPVSHIKEIARSRDCAMRVVVWECSESRHYSRRKRAHILGLIYARPDPEPARTAAGRKK